LENPSTFVQALTAAQNPDSTFNVSWGPETLGYDVEFNFAEEVGTTDDRDRAVRQSRPAFPPSLELRH